MTTIDVTPPTAIDEEKALLGCLLCDPRSYWDVADIVQPQDLYLVKHQWIMEAVVRLHQRRAPVDALTVQGELERRGQLAEVGGFLALSQLMDAMPSAIHAEAYGRAVEHAAVRRRLLMAASEVAKLAYDQAIGIDAVLERSERHLFAIAAGRNVGDLQHVRTAAAVFLERINALAADEAGVVGPTTGMPDLDTLLGGLGTENFNIIAGRPGMGKTSFLLNVVAHVAELPDMTGPVALFSLEMSEEQLIGRLVATRSEIDSYRLTRGKVQSHEWKRFNDATGWVSELPLYIDDTPGLTPSQLRSRCRRLHAEHGGLRLVVVDYVQLMSTTRRTESRQLEMTYISGQLKALARELKVPVFIAAQLSRSCEMRPNKRPQLSDLRESGALEQDADSVTFLYRDEYYSKEQTESPNVAEVELAKHRHGPTGRVEMFWRAELMRFQPLQVGQ